MKKLLNWLGLILGLLYGEQKGDLLSEISPLDQQKIMAEKTIDWLSSMGIKEK